MVIYMHKIEIPYINADNNCLFSALGNVLSWWGWNKNEIDHLFDGQLSFYYSFGMKSEYIDFTVIEDYPINFLLEKEPLARRLSQLFSPYNIICYWNEAAETENAWKSISAICSERPLVLFFDHYTLPYHSAYQKNHGAHFVTLIGQSGSQPYILDSIQNLFFSGFLDWDLKKEERVLNTDLADIHNAWIDLIPDAISSSSSSLIDSDRMIIDFVVRGMTTTSISNNRTWGLNAMHMFYEDMFNLFTSKDFVQDIQNNYVLSNSLEGLYISFLRISQQRRRFALFLSCSPILSRMTSDISSLLVQGYEELSELWKKLRDIIYIGYRRRSPNKLVSGLSLLDEIITKETYLIETLKNIIL